MKKGSNNRSPIERAAAIAAHYDAQMDSDSLSDPRKPQGCFVEVPFALLPTVRQLLAAYAAATEAPLESVELAAFDRASTASFRQLSVDLKRSNGSRKGVPREQPAVAPEQPAAAPATPEPAISETSVAPVTSAPASAGKVELDAKGVDCRIMDLTRSESECRNTKRPKKPNKPRG